MGQEIFCDGDEASGHHACMNGHLPTAHQRRDMYAYSGGGGESGGVLEKYGREKMRISPFFRLVKNGRILVDIR